MDFIDLKAQYRKYKEEIDKKIFEIISKAEFINGEENRLLEKECAEYCNVKYAVGVSSGTDALLIPLMALGIKENDEIITTPFTFAATAEVIALLKAKIVFVDIDEKNYNIDINKIEEKITKKTKAIIVVSLFGQIPDMDRLIDLCKSHNLVLIEDGAQSFGSIYKNKKSCSFNDIGATSFFPAKPLGCYGDGGMIFTDNFELYDKMKKISNHGQSKRYEHDILGSNFRLDNLQAGILRIKLKHFEEEANKRFDIGLKYNKLLANTDVITPYIEPYTTRTVFAQYSIRVKNRDSFIEKMSKKNIPTAVHYPKPLHLQKVFSYLGYKEDDFPVAERISKEIVSIPMHPFLTDNDIDFIVSSIKECLK